VCLRVFGVTSFTIFVRFFKPAKNSIRIKRLI